MNFFYSFNQTLIQILDFVAPLIPFAILSCLALIFFSWFISTFVSFIRRRFIWREKDD